MSKLKRQWKSTKQYKTQKAREDHSADMAQKRRERERDDPAKARRRKDQAAAYKKSLRCR